MSSSQVFASLLGQLMLSQGSGLTALFVVSSLSTLCALVLACLLPSPATELSLKSQPEHPDAAIVSHNTPSRTIQASASCAVLEDGAIAPVGSRSDLTAVLLSRRTWSKEGLSRARLVCLDVCRVMVESSAIRWYAWLAVGTAVHHLVLTYWQARATTSAPT